MHSVLAVASLLYLLVPPTAHALFVGVAPDSPAAHVDANTAASPWASVGSLSIGGNTFSATLIAADYVLTAGHVAYGVDPAAITFNLNAGGNLTQQIAALAVYTPPGFKGFNTTHLAGDLAIIRLAHPVTNVPIHPIYREELMVGTMITLVGYGSSGTGDKGVSGTVTGASPSVKRTGKNQMDYFVKDAGGRKSIYYFDFDGPDAGTNLMGGGTLGSDVEVTVGSGDSGSPAFYTDGSGKLWLAGVNTFSAAFRPGQINGTFGTGGGGMVLSAYASWIDSILSQMPDSAPRP